MHRRVPGGSGGRFGQAGHVSSLSGQDMAQLAGTADTGLLGTSKPAMRSACSAQSEPAERIARPERSSSIFLNG